MASAVQLIVLLACIFLCTSAGPIMRCQCIKTVAAVRREFIKEVKVLEPNPACKNREVIVVRNDDKEICLDLKSSFTQNLLKNEMCKKKLSTTTTRTTTRTTTTAAATQSAATATLSEISVVKD